MGLHIVVIGNPFDGLRIVGAFNNSSEAIDWAEANVDDEDWWAVSVEAPEAEADRS